MKAATARPQQKPSRIIAGISHREFSSTAGIVKTAPAVDSVRRTAAAEIAASMTGIKPTTVYSAMITSMAKITPARGVLKAAAMPPAVPQAISTRRLLLGRPSFCPSRLLTAPPR
jgi:hypothetical protein